MIERTPIVDLLTHLVLVAGLLLLLLPVYVVVVAASHDLAAVNQVPMPLLPGRHLWENLAVAWQKGNFRDVMITSVIVASLVAAGKVGLSAISAYSIVYFDYRLRAVFFWIIFATLMLPLEVRIVPTYAVAANALEPFQGLLDLSGLSVTLPRWNLLNSYSGLVLPLVATATGTFLYRQFFMTIPDELAEAAKMDGAGAFRFFKDVILPLSVTNMAALGTIMFVYAWNQYLWPLLVVTDQDHATASMQLGRLVPSAYGEAPIWNTAMAGTLIVMAPPLAVVMLLQRWFVRGLVAVEK